MAGMDSLRGKVDFQINFTITKKNENQIPAIFSLAEAVAAKALHFFFLVPTGRGSEMDQISAERQRELLELIERLRAKGSLEVQVTCAPQYARLTGLGRGCLAAKSFIFLSRKGEVYPCGYLPLLAGSIREESFRNIWENSPVLKALRERDLHGKCGVCGYSESCGGCRARAFAKTGDYLGPDPQCLEAC
jgi:radical SAM protein with 4Fe4S-binding SPASM domain